MMARCASCGEFRFLNDRRRGFRMHEHRCACGGSYKKSTWTESARAGKLDEALHTFIATEVAPQ